MIPAVGGAHLSQRLSKGLNSSMNYGAKVVKIIIKRKVVK